MSSDWILAGRYRLISLLGRGGMGEVWRAEHLELRAHVAVKLMGQSIAANEEALQRFNREARAAAALRSPHVVQILDHGTDAATGIPFIAMELMEGESLAQRLGRVKHLSEADTARIVTHVARALSRAHEAGIVHRDLKPDNVFLIRNEDEEIAKVLDFGIAKANSQSLAYDFGTRTGALMGTPYYMSPEQISGSRDVDYRTDLWALGVIAFECLTGYRPFMADSIGGLALAICTHPIPRPSYHGMVAPGFDAWFERAIDRDPARRYQSARELADELRRALGAPSAAVTMQSGPPHGLQAPQPLNVAVASVGPMSRTSQGKETAAASRVLVPLLAASLLLGLCGTGVTFFVRKLRAAAAPDTTTAAAIMEVPPPVKSVALPAVSAAPQPPPEPVPSASASSAVAASPEPVPKAVPTLSPSSAPPPKRRRAIAPAATPKPAVDSGSIFDRRKG